MVDLAVLAGVVFAFGLVSRWLEGPVMTAPIAFVAAGIFLGPAGLGLVEFALDDHAVLLLSEVAISLLATRLDGMSVLFAGWFGPRGLASIVPGLIVLSEAPGFAGRRDRTRGGGDGAPQRVVARDHRGPLSAAYAGRVEGRDADAPTAAKRRSRRGGTC